MFAPFLIAAVVGYLLGSLPFGYWVAHAKGVNIFEVGSKNPGATNVRRVLGNGPGNLVLLLDALKGALAVGWLRIFALGPNGIHHRGWNWPAAVREDLTLKLCVVGLVFALLGHGFSCFTKFRGGKGVATAAGGFLILFPWGMLVAATVWALTLAATRYTSLASMLAGVALTVAAWLRHTPPILVGACAVAMIFVIIRHRANISRLLAGTENKIGRRKESPDSP